MLTSKRLLFLLGLCVFGFGSASATAAPAASAAPRAIAVTAYRPHLRAATATTGPTAARPPSPARPSPAQAVAPAVATVKVSFLAPSAGLQGQPDVATLSIPGRAGTYLVPYIQTEADLKFKLDVQGVGPDESVEVVLDAEDPDQARGVVLERAPFTGSFAGIGMGEHTLTASVVSAPLGRPQDATREEPSVLASAHLSHVARGDIVSAMGDSTTEGLGGPAYDAVIPNWVAAGSMAAEWTTPDGRNYPQAGAVTKPRSPVSFTTLLGKLLEEQRGHPVLVLNDGWSGATAQAYTHIVASGDLRAEYAAAKPNGWLINLGVNDPLTRQTAPQFDASMHTIVGDLVRLFAAAPADIHVACPIYARQENRHNWEEQYLPVIDNLRTSAGLGAAPNFYAYYRDDPAAEADQVHPNAAGYHDMAVLWAQALGGAASSCQ